MKKTLLLAALSFVTVVSNAQFTLTGTQYTQNFNTVGSGLPTGWNVYVNATPSAAGDQKSLTGSGVPALPFETLPDTGCGGSDNCAGLVRAGGFKNYPSADYGTPLQSYNFCPGCTEVSTTPFTSNRALGVRQVSGSNGSFPGTDPDATHGGAAFVFKITKTTGFKNFNLAFELQSLDTSSSRVTTWSVDYGISASSSAPTTFTAATATGATTTGGHTFSNNMVSVNFGNNLDNKPGQVWIRIAALAATTTTPGNGNRATTAIDSFKLTYETMPAGVEDISAQSAMSLTVLGTPTSDEVVFAYNVVENHNLNFAIYDLSGRVIRKEEISNNTGTYTASGLNLAPGMYIAKMSNKNGSAVAKIMVK